MSRTVTTKTTSGLIAVRDAGACQPIGPDGAAEFSKAATQEGFFVVDTGGEAQLRLEVCVGDERPHAAPDCYEPVGGMFRLEVSSGLVRICDPTEPATGEDVTIPSGTYALTPLRLKTNDLAAYRAQIRNAVGEDAWRFRDRIEKLELTGCATIVLAAVLAAEPLTRTFWWIYVPLLLAPYLSAWLLKLTPRYKKAERERKAFEGSQPHLVLLLKLDTGLSRNAPGGRIVFT